MFPVLRLFQRSIQTPSIVGLGKKLHTSSWLQKHVSMFFIDRNGNSHKVNARIGDNLLDVVRDNDLNFESFGVCDAAVSCSTCHVILPQHIFDSLEEADLEEEDMLDLACGLSETSRLGCQVDVSEAMEGIVVKLPSEIIDARLM